VKNTCEKEYTPKESTTKRPGPNIDVLSKTTVLRRGARGGMRENRGGTEIQGEEILLLEKTLRARAELSSNNTTEKGC